MTGILKPKRALISVSDKTDIVRFASFLGARGVEIVSTGNTAKALRDAGKKVVDISDFTGFPEMMDGRLKTLHPKVHGGILAVRDNPTHLQAMEQYGIGAIDLVVVNLYAFEEKVAQGAPHEEIVENIDIGGPAMIRSAAKNYRSVAVVVNPERYDTILLIWQINDGLSAILREELAQEAFERTARYDAAIDAYFRNRLGKSQKQ